MNEIVTVIKLSTSMIVSMMAINSFGVKHEDPFFEILSNVAIGIGFVTTVYVFFWMSGL